MDTTELTYRSPIYWKPVDEFDDLRQRDQAAESARQWARRSGYYMVNVVSVNRGRKNLVVRMTGER